MDSTATKESYGGIDASLSGGATSGCRPSAGSVMRRRGGLVQGILAKRGLLSFEDVERKRARGGGNRSLSNGTFENLPDECVRTILSHLSPLELYGSFGLSSLELHRLSRLPGLPQTDTAVLTGAFHRGSVMTLAENFAVNGEELSTKRCIELHDHEGIRSATWKSVSSVFRDCRILTNVEELHLSFPSTEIPEGQRRIPGTLLRFLGIILPNIRSLFVNNVANLSSGISPDFSCWQSLEAVHYSSASGGSALNYFDAGLRNASQLKEIWLDNNAFFLGAISFAAEEAAFPRCFPLCQIGWNLERASLVNARCHQMQVPRACWPALPDQGVVDFVRGTPTLKWLRCSISDQTAEMLRRDHPSLLLELSH